MLVPGATRRVLLHPRRVIPFCALSDGTQRVALPGCHLKLVPITITNARRFVDQTHRHALPPQGGLFAVSVVNNGEQVGVAIAGRPVARMLDDGKTIEITRVSTDGTRNACSMLYGAICRAGKALGYTKAITYTLESEPGTSLRASGWTHSTKVPAQKTWNRKGRSRYDQDLFGDPRRDPGPKVRWERTLSTAT